MVQYLRQERRQESGKKPGGTAGRLEAAYAQASDGAGRRAYLLEALSVLEKTGKPLLRREPEPDPDLPPVQTAKNRLLAYAKSTGCPALARAARWDKKACCALLAYLQEHDAPPPGAALIETLHAELQDSLLRREAEDYLYNAKNGRKQNRDMMILEAYLDRHYNRYATEDDESKTNSSLDVYYTRGSAGTQQHVWTEEAMEKSQRFFESLQKKKHRYVWIPVEIDPRTAAGVYFIGMGHLMSVGIDQRDNSDGCRIACLYFRGFDPRSDELDADDEDGQKVNVILPMWTGSLEELRDLCDFPHVEEALTWHRRMLDAGDAQAPLNEFRDLNENPPPECPPEYLCYFETPGARQPLDLDAARQDGRRSFAQEKTPLQKR